jgi:hypothetical protein
MVGIPTLYILLINWFETTVIQTKLVGMEGVLTIN